MGLKNLPVLAVMFCLIGIGSLSAAALDVEGHWTGGVSFRGAHWPMRLDIRQARGTLQATLDIPALVMAWEPIPVAALEGSLRIELPFGLGEFELRSVGDRLVSPAPTDTGETIQVEFHRSDPPRFSREEVRFRSGDLTLAGTLMRPATKGPHPAVVLVHGSEPQGRESWSYRSWADFFVRRGHSVLYYDKRGVGESAGQWQTAAFSELADDVDAAVRFLHQQEDIDPGRIGLCGGSQGGWVAMLSASRSKEISYLILRSTPVVTPAEQESQRIEYGMRAAGFSAEDIQAAHAYTQLYFYVVHTGEGWPLLHQAALRAPGTEWGDWVDQPRKEEDLSWWKDNHQFDPRVPLEQLTLPILALYGGADTSVPPIENVEKLKSYYGGRTEEDLVIEVFPGADHRGEVSAGTGPDGKWSFPHIADRLLGSMERWLEAQDSPSASASSAESRSDGSSSSGEGAPAAASGGANNSVARAAGSCSTSRSVRSMARVRAPV